MADALRDDNETEVPRIMISDCSELHLPTYAAGSLIIAIRCAGDHQWVREQSAALLSSPAARHMPFDLTTFVTCVMLPDDRETYARFPDLWRECGLPVATKCGQCARLVGESAAMVTQVVCGGCGSETSYCSEDCRGDSERCRPCSTL